MLVDDLLPTNQLSCLAYLKAARRSLWGPLIEKAAAKLHGSYEARTPFAASTCREPSRVDGVGRSSEEGAGSVWSVRWESPLACDTDIRRDTLHTGALHLRACQV